MRQLMDALFYFSSGLWYSFVVSFVWFGDPIVTVAKICAYAAIFKVGAILRWRMLQLILGLIMMKI